MAKTSRRTKTKAAETGFRRQAQKTARRERSIQRKIDRRDKRRGKAHKEKGAMQAGEPAQLLGKLALVFVVVEVGDVDQAASLLPQYLHNPLVGVAERIHA